MADSLSKSASGFRKKKRQAKMAKTMGEFKRGQLHSGSKHGPMVKSRNQAIAIAISQAKKAKL